MSARRVPADIRKIEILCDQETLYGLCGTPHVGVGSTGQLLSANGINVVRKSTEDRDEAVGQVFVEFDPHRLIGVSIRGMSSCAEPAANAAARMSSSDNVGKSARISAVVEPSARLASTVFSVTRVPFRIGSPRTHNLRIPHDAVLVVHVPVHFSATGGVVDGRRWLADQGTTLDSVATQLLPESKKPRKHSEIVDPTLGSEQRGRSFKSPRPTTSGPRIQEDLTISARS